MFSHISFIKILALTIYTFTMINCLPLSFFTIINHLSLSLFTFSVEFVTRFCHFPKLHYKLENTHLLKVPAPLHLAQLSGAAAAPEGFCKLAHGLYPHALSPDAVSRKDMSLQRRGTSQTTYGKRRKELSTFQCWKHTVIHLTLLAENQDDHSKGGKQTCFSY